MSGINQQSESSRIVSDLTETVIQETSYNDDERKTSPQKPMNSSSSSSMLTFLEETFDRSWFYRFFILSAYTAFGILGYSFLEPEWSPFDALYFSFMQISTVGYGCLVPSSSNSRLFTMVFIVGSIPIIAGCLAGFIRPFVEIPHQQMDRVMLYLFPILDDTNDDPVNPPSATRYYGRKLVLLLSFAHFGACFLTALVTYGIGQNPDTFLNSLSSDPRLSFMDALYFTIVTSSTVGFGDICPNTDAARGYTILTTSYGLGVLTLFVDQFLETVKKRRKMLKTAKRYQKEMEHREVMKEFVTSKKYSISHRNNSNPNGGGNNKGGNKKGGNDEGVIDRCEFLEGMLTMLDLVSQDEMQKILRRFDTADIHKKGFINKEQLAQMLELRADVVKNTISMKKESVAPRLSIISEERVPGGGDEGSESEEGDNYI